MKKILGAILLSGSLTVSAEGLPPQINDLIPELQKWGQDSSLITAVTEQNKSGLTIEAIKLRDTEWRATDGLDDRMKAIMENSAAKRLLELEKSQPYFFEVFLMDNQGANVAMTNKTSDYWQGDEAKWQESFKDGTGAVHVGDVEFDESAQDYLVQISVPVMDSGKAIGAITIGVNLDLLEGKVANLMPLFFIK